MTNEERHKYYCSRAWAKLKEAVKKRSGGRCERCWFNEHEQTHHLTYIRFGNERLEDLQGLCAGCHEFLSGKTDVDPCDKTCLCPRCHHEDFTRHSLCDCCFYNEVPFTRGRCLCGDKSDPIGGFTSPKGEYFCACIPKKVITKIMQLVGTRQPVAPKQLVRELVKQRKKKPVLKPTPKVPHDFDFGGFDFDKAAARCQELNFRPAWTRDQIPTADQLRELANKHYPTSACFVVYPREVRTGSGGLEFKRLGNVASLTLKIGKRSLEPITASWEIEKKIVTADDI